MERKLINTQSRSLLMGLKMCFFDTLIVLEFLKLIKNDTDTGLCLVRVAQGWQLDSERVFSVVARALYRECTHSSSVDTPSGSQ